MIARMILLISTSLTFTSCLTYRWQAHVPEDQLASPAPKPVQPANQVPKFVKIEPMKSRGNHFMVSNLSQEMVYVSYKQSVVEFAGSSYRVVSGETRGINRDRDSPDTPIAPNTTAEVSFYTEDNTTSELMQKGSAAINYRVAIRKEDKKPKYAILHGTSADEKKEKELLFTTESQGNNRLACYITGILYGGWCWFVHPTEEDHKIAEEKGKSKYGPQTTVEYQGRQNNPMND